MNAKRAHVMENAPGGIRRTGNPPALIGRLALAAALAVFLLLCAQRPAGAQTPEHAAALRLLEKEQWEEADKAFSALADGEGVDPVALSGRAAARRNLGDAEGARSDVERVLAEYPEHAEAYYQRARLAMSEKRNEAALRDLNRAILLRADHAPSYWQRAYIHSQAGRHAEAVADYQKGVELRPRDLTALNNLAGAQLLNGDTAAAVETYTRVIELDPANIWEHGWRAKAREKLGDKTGARADAAAAARLKAEDSGAAATFDSLRKRQQEAVGGTTARVTSAAEPVAARSTPEATPPVETPAVTPATGPTDLAPLAAGPKGDDPVSVLQRFLGAQARGDAAAMLAETAQSRLSADEAARLRADMTRLAGKVRMSDVRFAVVAQGTSRGGTMALVRFRISCTVRAGGAEVAQASGNMALLTREGRAWKLHTVAADEALTLEVFESVPAPRQTAAVAPLFHSPLLQAAYSRDAALRERAVRMEGVQYAQRPTTQGLYDIKAVNEAINRAVDTWRVDEGKLTRDTVYSAWGHFPILGDVVSNCYTVYERGKTLLVELPESVRSGNVEAALLDVSLIAWGGVQIVAEVVPGLDSATDAIEAGLDQYRYNAVQRFSYMNVVKMLARADFRGMKKYLIIRFTEKNDPVRDPKHLSSRAHREWQGKWPALSSLTFLSDEYLRRDPRVWFEVGTQLEIKKSENETIYAAAESIGARTERSGSFDDRVAYIPLRINSMAVADASKGDPILQDFTLRADARNLAYRYTCTRGRQTIVVRLSDGTQTEPLEIDNLVFNAVEGVKLLVPGRQPTDELKMQMGDRISGARIVPVMSATPGAAVTPPELTGLACMTTDVVGLKCIGVTMSGTWPSATIGIAALEKGIGVLEVHYERGGGVRQNKWPLIVEVADKRSPATQRWVIKEIRRHGPTGAAREDSKGAALSPGGGDTRVSRTRTGHYWKQNADGRQVQVSYDATASGSWDVPSTMEPGGTASVSISASHSSSGPKAETAVIATFPAWEKKETPAPKAGNVGGNPFAAASFAVMGRRTAVATSGDSASASVTLHVPEARSAGGQVQISVSVYERSVGAKTMTDAANRVEGRTFVYELVDVP